MVAEQLQVHQVETDYLDPFQSGFSLKIALIEDY